MEREREKLFAGFGWLNLIFLGCHNTFLRSLFAFRHPSQRWKKFHFCSILVINQKKTRSTFISSLCWREWRGLLSVRSENSRRWATRTQKKNPSRSIRDAFAALLSEKTSSTRSEKSKSKAWEQIFFFFPLLRFSLSSVGGTFKVTKKLIFCVLLSNSIELELRHTGVIVHFESVSCVFLREKLSRDVGKNLFDLFLVRADGGCMGAEWNQICFSFSLLVQCFSAVWWWWENPTFHVWNSVSFAKFRSLWVVLL